MKEIKFEWENGIDEIALEIKKYKKIGLQIPEGLRTRASDIIEKIEDNGPKVFLWGEPTYGACDLADGPFADIEIEALIHMGHLPMPYHSDSYKIPVFFVPVRHSGNLELKKDSINKAYFPDKKTFIEYFSNHKKKYNVIYIKGSRSMKLENIISGLFEVKC